MMFMYIHTPSLPYRGKMNQQILAHLAHIEPQAAPELWMEIWLLPRKELWVPSQLP